MASNIAKRLLRDCPCSDLLGSIRIYSYRLNGQVGSAGSAGSRTAATRNATGQHSSDLSLSVRLHLRSDLRVHATRLAGRVSGRGRCANGEDDCEATLPPMKRALALGKVAWRPADEGLRTIMRRCHGVMTLASNIGVYLTTFPAV